MSTHLFDWGRNNFVVFEESITRLVAFIIKCAIINLKHTFMINIDKES